jgi:hypothetical protein
MMMLRRPLASAVALFAAIGVTSWVAMAPASASTLEEKAASLSIVYRADTAKQPVTWTLNCPSRTGTHPNASGACDRLESLTGDPFAPVPKGTLCLTIYGGPQTASITGNLGDMRVAASFRLVDSCEIARWKKLVPVLPDIAAL